MDGQGAKRPAENGAGMAPGGVRPVLDTISRGLLLAWVALALAGLAFGSAVGARLVDAAAWAAFAAAFLLSGLPRWLRGISDSEAIGPFRLWGTACAAALLFCIASSFIATPKMAEAKARIRAQEASLAPAPDRLESLYREHARAKNFSVQFVCIRILLAVGLAMGTKKLPGEVRGG
jgi:hypothetical protein